MNTQEQKQTIEAAFLADLKLLLNKHQMSIYTETEYDGDGNVCGDTTYVVTSPHNKKFDRFELPDINYYDN